MWVYTIQISLHKNNLFIDFLNHHQTTEWSLFSLEQTDCIRLHQQKYILKVRLDRNSPLSELFTLSDTIIASIISVFECSFKTHSLMRTLHNISYVPV